jgi:hypothetical protein
VVGLQVITWIDHPGCRLEPFGCVVSGTDLPSGDLSDIRPWSVRVTPGPITSYAPGVGPFLRYSLLRLVILVGAVALFRLLGAGVLTAVVLGVVTSAALSYLFLGRSRDAVVARMVVWSQARRPRRSRFARGVAEDTAAEDAATPGPATGDAATPGPAAGDAGGGAAS